MIESWLPGAVAHVDPLTDLRVVYEPDSLLYRWCLDTGYHTHYWFNDHWVQITPDKEDDESTSP